MLHSKIINFIEPQLYINLSYVISLNTFCISVTAAPEVFDNTKYCVPEYYQYNEMSFYDIDRDMANFRLPQQSKY